MLMYGNNADENPRHLLLTRINISELCPIDELVDNENFFEEDILESNRLSYSLMCLHTCALMIQNQTNCKMSVFLSNTRLSLLPNAD